jgi:predicted ATPase
VTKTLTTSPFIRAIEFRRDKVTDLQRYPFSIPAIASLRGLCSRIIVTSPVESSRGF